jgi:DNA ligase (NAD+)
MSDSDQQKIEQLRKNIQRHDHLYYVQDAPEITDRDYDRLMQSLKELEEKYPEWVTPESPTQRVGGQPAEGFESVVHKVPMLSLDNTYNVEELREFHNRVVKNLGTEEVEYVVELKIDGLGVSLTYEDGILVRGATRGDGKTGEDITANLKTIRSIPLTISMSEAGYRSMEVRGEVYMDRKGFDALNHQREEAGESPFVNPRNAAAGSLRLLDSRITASRPLNIWVYALGHFEGPAFNTHFEMLNQMGTLGFRTNPNTQLCKSFDDIQKMIDTWQEKQATLNYDVDGLVIKVNSIPAQNKLGSTNKHIRAGRRRSSMKRRKPRPWCRTFACRSGAPGRSLRWRS